MLLFLVVASRSLNASPAKASALGTLNAAANLAVRNPVVVPAVVIGVAAVGTAMAARAAGNAARSALNRLRGR